MKDLGRLTGGLFFEDLALGTRWHSAGRTVFESDLAGYVNLTWFTEELFTNMHDRTGFAIQGRPVPAIMVMAFAEGLVLSSMDRTGLAFLHVEMDVKGPTQVGDTLYVQCEVIELKRTSSGDKGLVRTRNTVTNQSGQVVLVYQPLRLVKCRTAPG
jgi:hypothetical protein